ncbi:DUF429 domain-containing protein [Rhodococcus sp. NPDC057297]|uniref:DUF429 domain-containing protein n=1 Tax=Rhodococcus sp. NPDC057297 TaxID=3346090 RepID=UPI00363AF017
MGFQGRKTVAGVDGAKGKWVVALFDGQDLRMSVEPDVRAVLAATRWCDVVGVDMPLSLPESGYRVSELEAKSFLGPARSSIFHTPVRSVLDTQTYEDACAVSRRITGKAISKQTWYLMSSIRQWQDVSFDPERVVEVHPECSFRHMAPDTSFVSKKSARGIGQRLSALSTWLDPVSVHDAMALLPVEPAADDALDAVAAAWSAWRFGRGKHRYFGTSDGVDRIVA